MSVPMKLGTRGSALALAQAETVCMQVAGLLPGQGAVLEVFKTSGDRFSIESPDAPTGPKETQGLFTKELDEALLAGKVGACIHSLKDMPTVLTHGVCLAAVLKREDVRDALVSVKGVEFRDLPSGARVGTSSPRRTALIRNVRPDLSVVPLRGNLDTRLKKLREGQYDAVVVAMAGLKRLGRGSEANSFLEPPDFLPSPSQGALGLTVRVSDHELIAILKTLDDPETRICVEAERAFLRELQGGCSVPVGAHAFLVDGRLVVRGVVAELDGTNAVRSSVEGPPEEAVKLGVRLAEWCLANGAQQILMDIRGSRP